MGSKKKGRRHRTVNRRPRPTGSRASARRDGGFRLPWQAGADRPVPAYRDHPEMIDHRAYPETARLVVDDMPFMTGLPTQSTAPVPLSLLARSK